jgi:hypothetical protein
MLTNNQVSLSLQAHHGTPAGLSKTAGYLSVDSAISVLDMPANQTIFSVHNGSLQLGVAENGFPIMVDLYDPAPGPVLVAGDGGSGKTAFLQSLTLGSDLQDPGEILFGVLTPFPEEWGGLEILSNCLGIWPAYHPAARQFLSQLVSWADVLPSSHQVVILIVDDLDLLITNGFHDQHNLRWMLTYGPRRQVWPVVAINPGRLTHPETWLDYFQTRVLGRVKRPQTAHLLITDPEIDLAELPQRGQYVLWRQDGCLKFRLPSVS